MKKIRFFGKKQKKDQTRTDVVCYQITEILTQLKDHDETEPFNVTIEDGQGRAVNATRTNARSFCNVFI